MLMIYDDVAKKIMIVRGLEYAKWLKNIDVLNLVGTNNGVNAFEQNPVKWEQLKLSTEKQIEEFERFKAFVVSNLEKSV